MSDELTVHAELVIDRLMDAVAAGDRDAVGRALEGAPMMHVVVGLAYGLYKQEVANEVLAGQVSVLDNANIALFAERRHLRERVTELRGLLDARSSAVVTRGAARVAA